MLYLILQSDRALLGVYVYLLCIPDTFLPV